MDEYDVLLEKLSEEVYRVSRDLEILRRQRVIKIVNVNREDWTPPVKEVHTCTDECDDVLHVMTLQELETAHRKARDHVDWLNRFMPLPDKD